MYNRTWGVHSCAVGMTLTAAPGCCYEIKDGLGDFLRKSDGNYWSRSEHYTVDAFRETGRVAVPLADGYDLSCEGAN